MWFGGAWSERGTGAATILASVVLLGIPGLDAQVTPLGPGEISFQTVAPRSFLGVGVAEIDSNRSRALNLKEDRGVEITRVESNSPAEHAGLQVGDVVLSYAGQKVVGIEQFARLVRETPAGRAVKMEVNRGGRSLTLPVTIGLRKTALLPVIPNEEMEMLAPMLFGFAGAPDVPKTVMCWTNSSLGMEGETVEGQLAEYFGAKAGVLVRSVAVNSPAHRAGIRAGDVILKVDGQPISSPREISSILRNKRLDTTLSLQMLRNHRDMTIDVPVEDPAAQRPRRTPARSVKN